MIKWLCLQVTCEWNSLYVLLFRCERESFWWYTHYRTLDTIIAYYRDILDVCTCSWFFVRHLAGAEKTIEEQRQKVAFLDSALQQLSIQLNAADNSKKTSESKAKQLEERIHEMENSVVGFLQLSLPYSSRYTFGMSLFCMSIKLECEKCNNNNRTVIILELWFDYSFWF